MSTYKLYYFNVRGVAEVSRLIFLLLTKSQMPVLEVDGVQLPQSAAIGRFLAKKFHLAGKDDFEQAEADAVVDTIYDIMKAYSPISQEQDESKKQELTKNFFVEQLPKHLQNLEILGKLYGHSGEYFVNNQLTWADLFFHTFGETLLGVDEHILNNHPWLKQNRTEVEKHPRIAEYLKNRPKSLF
ncbi:unnamed protein product [Adineta ricciae]|uniref:glutathione transferase n=1 Tax=Adineta ricciae TaxID=249248 RepID=A0A813V244_ADIRI|nr:unnamed protein product [Adineta ricciae]